MIKTLSKAQKMEREKFRIPRSVQDAIPIRRIFADGIFQVGNQYSKTWSFTDINYAIAGKEDKTSMFLDYSELLNALDSGASAKITIYNRRINKAEFERSVLLPDRGDGLDEYRHEFNQMLTAQVTGTSNSIVRERYLTVSVVKRNADEARGYFARVGTDLVTHLAQLSSVARELTLNERLHIFRDFFKAGEQAAAEFNIHEHAKRGQHFKDWFCPDSMEFAADHFKLDARYGRVLYLQDYASYIKDSFVSELCDLDRDLMLSIDILPVPTDEAARQLQSTLLGVETNVANWQRRQNANNNFAATIPYDMELQRKETKEMLDDLTTRDQRMMFGLVTLVHLADSKEQLDSDTETLYSTARKHLCQLSMLRWQQKDGLDTVLPYGLRKIQALRTLTTESTAVLIPFRAQEIMQPNGLYYGQNAVSKNMIVADRRLLLNGNSFRLGVSGSGKSMSAKEEIVQIALSTEDDILILDPESEFGYLTEALGGEVIRISATSDTHINALDMDRAYGDERNPIVSKSEFVLSLFEQLIGDGMVTAKEKSILGRCTEQVYLPYIRNGYKGTPPTLQDFYRLLQMQPEPEAQGLALSSELFITGTLNTFARHTNVDTQARIIAYDIRELGEQLILQNEKYCGDVLLQKTFTEDVLTGVHKKNTGQLPQYYIENYHEGIVSKQMFREVQAEIARRNSKSAANQRKRRRGRYNSKYALSERLFCGDCGSPYKRVTWNIHGRKQIVWRCVNRIEYGTKFCGSSPSIPEEELHRAILKAVQGLAANFTDEVAAQINGILHDIQTGESAKPNLQEQLEQTQQEFDRLLEMSLDFDEGTPFLDDRLKKLNSKIKRLREAIDDSAAQQEKASQPEMLLSAKDLQIQEYDDALTARIIEKITVRSRNEIEIRFIGGYKKTMQLT